jgi:hypothetical protein
VDRWTPVSAVISRIHKTESAPRVRSADAFAPVASGIVGRGIPRPRPALNEPVRRSVGSEFDSVCARFGDVRDMSGNPVRSVSASLIDVGSADTWVDASSYGTTKGHQQTYMRDDPRVRLVETAFAIQPAGTHADLARQVSQTVATRRVSTKVSTTARSPTIVGSQPVDSGVIILVVLTGSHLLPKQMFYQCIRSEMQRNPTAVWVHFKPRHPCEVRDLLRYVARLRKIT